MLGVVASEGLETVNTTESGACGSSMLHTEQGFHVVNVKVLGIAEFGLWDDAKSLEEAVWRILVAVYIIMMEHDIAKVGWRLIYERK